MSKHRVVRAASSLALACALAGLLVACAPPGAAPRFPLVVLVAVDGLRGDHLGASGYPRPTSPFLDALAERSAVFDRAYAASSRSLTSQASLFTGLAPDRHGVWTEESPGLAPGVATVAERMREAGYETAAFVSTRRDWARSGVLRGFDHVEAPSRLMPRSYRRGGDTVEAALAWWGARAGDAPAFLYLQLSDPVKPFTPLPEPAARALEGVLPDDLVEYVASAHRLKLGYFNYEHRHVLRLMNRYDGELRGLDTALATLYEGLGASPGALWVVTATHGMGLANHAWDGAQRQIHETQVRVPLFVHTPSGAVSPAHHDGVVSHLALGSALVALARGDAQEPASALATDPAGALVQRGTFGPLVHESRRLGLPEEDPLPENAWVAERLKLFRHADGTERVFDVVADPYETEDLAATVDPEALEALRSALARALESPES